MRTWRVVLFFNIALLVFVTMWPRPAQTGPIDKQIGTAQQKETSGDYEAAQKIYESILAKNPQHHDGLLGLARVQYWQGNYRASVATYEKFLKIYPEDAGGLVGLGKAYLALGDDKKAKAYFEKAQKLEPKNEEVEAIQPELEPKAFIEIEGGLEIQDFNYASDAQSEYQNILYQKERRYGGGIYSGYVNQFSRQEFNTGLFGNFYPTPGTRLEAEIYFSPAARTVAQIAPAAAIRQDIGKYVTPGLDYGYQKFKGAHFQNVTPSLQLHPFSFLAIGGDTELQFASVPSGDKTLYSYSGNLTLAPTEWFNLWGSYGKISRTFEAGRTVPDFEYTANVLNTGIKVIAMHSLLIRFHFGWEDRNNGESVYRYLFGLGYRM